MKKLFGSKKKDDQAKKGASDSAVGGEASAVASTNQALASAPAPALPPKPAAVSKATSPTTSSSHAEVLKAVGGEDKNVPGKAEFIEGEQRLNLSKYHEALDFYEQSAKLGYPPAHFRIWYVHAELLKDITAEKSSELLVAFQGNLSIKCQDESLFRKDPMATNILGLSAYYAGGDYRRAIKYFIEAGNLGDGFAQHMVGFCYSSGKGVDQDEREGLKWYEMAAEQGNAKAESNLGLALKNGTGGIKPDPKRALALMERAASKNLPSALNNLGHWYQKGECGLGVNERKAFELFMEAAKKGNADAQCSVGFYYSKGKGGVKKDKAVAISWYKKAADQGHEGAKRNLEVKKSGGKKKGYHYHYSYHH